MTEPSGWSAVFPSGTWIGGLSETERGLALDVCGVLTADELRALAALIDEAANAAKEQG